MTLDLSTEELFLFQHNGYLLIREALSNDLAARLKTVIHHHVDRRIPPLVCENPEKPGYGVSGDLPGARVLRLSRVLGRDPVFREAASSPPLVGALRALLGANVDVVLNRHNHITVRPPGVAPLEWHRDVVNWSRPIVSAMFYLDDSTIERGCTWIVPGSHQMLAYHARLTAHARAETLETIGVQALPVPAAARDVLLLNALVLHSAGPNRSDAPRLSMTLGYHAADELGSEDEPYKELIAGERVLIHNTPGSPWR
jgi:phytanoyl-CoA hydroxylase